MKLAEVARQDNRLRAQEATARKRRERRQEKKAVAQFQADAVAALEAKLGLDEGCLGRQMGTVEDYQLRCTVDGFKFIVEKGKGTRFGVWLEDEEGEKGKYVRRAADLVRP